MCEDGGGAPGGTALVVPSPLAGVPVTVAQLKLRWLPKMEGSAAAS